MTADVLAIIVTCNASPWIAAALESLLQDAPAPGIVVVDNASRDGTAGLVQSFSPQVTLIEMPRNLGFAAANNRGLKLALERGAPYVFLLNQDAKAGPGAVPHLMAQMEKRPEFGILSPLHLDYEGRSVDTKTMPYLQHAAGFFSDALLQDLQEVYEIPFINAAAWLIRRSVLEKIGGFDPLYFMYGEDNDFCARARFHGFKIGIAPRARALHWHGGPGGSCTPERRAQLLSTQAITMLKRPDRGFGSNVPGFCLAWTRAFLHACIECDWPECRAIAASFGTTLMHARVVRRHQLACRNPGPAWL